MSLTDPGRVSVPAQATGAASAAAAPDAAHTRTDTVRDAVHAGACVLSGVLVTIGFAVSRGIGEGDGPDMIASVAADANRFYAGNLVAAVGLALIAAVGLAVLRLVRGRARVLATVGGVLVMVGAVAAAAGNVMFGAVVSVLAETLDAPQAAAAEEALADSARTGITFIVGFPGTFLGLLLCAIALLVSRATPRWVPVALIAGIALVLSVGQTDAAVLGDVVLTAGLAGVGLSLWKAVRPG